MIGVDDEQYGQRLAAFVVLDHGARRHGRDAETARARQPGELQSAARRSPCSTNSRAASPARSCAATCTALRRQWRKRRRPLLRAPSELANAANGVRPFGRDGYSDHPGVLVRLADHRDGAAVPRRFDARRACGAGCAAITPVVRGRIALLLKGITWGAARPDHVPQRDVRAVLRDAAARRRSATTTQVIAAQSQPAAGARNLVGVPPHELIRRRYVEKADIVSYGPHREANFADIWRRRDLPRDGKAPVLLQVPGGAWVDRHAPTAGLSAAEPPRRTRLGMRVDRLPGQPPAHLARSHRRRQARAGLDQGTHRRIRRRPRLRRDHRRFGGRPPVRAGGPDTGRPAVPARIRGRRHLGGGSGADLRPLRLVLHQGTRAAGSSSWFCCRGSSSRRGSKKHRQVYLDASPITRVRADAPPFFVLHGVDDSLIPVPEAREFVAALRDESKEIGRLLRDSARPARIRLLRVAARLTTPPRRSRSSCPGCTPPATRALSYCAIAFSTTVSSSESPAARRISTNASIIASVSSCGSSRVAPSDSTEMLSWST